MRKEIIVSKEDLNHYEKFIGLTFTDEQKEDMIKFANWLKLNYNNLRNIKFPNDLKPALNFSPQLPGISYEQKQEEQIFSKIINFEKTTNNEDIAYLSILQLSYLLRNQELTSVDLTKLYLKRLKQYDPILQCVITYTEDLAFMQVEQADKEINEGKYRNY